MSAALATFSERHQFLAAALGQAQQRISEVIPLGCGLAPSRAIAIVLDACSRNPALLECTTKSIVRTVVAAAEVGLELGSPHGEAHIVPFNDRKKGVTQATLIIGYKGFVKLIRGGPKVTIVKSTLVREQDEFINDEGNNKLTHIVASGTTRERGKVTYAYARVYYESGQSQYEVMDHEELAKIRNSSKDTRPSAPWNAHTDEMYKKCPLRRMAKWLDLSQSARRAAEIDAFEATMRGELPGIQREGFQTGRAEDLKAMFTAQNETTPQVIDAELDE